MTARPAKHSLTLHGHRTSVSLETEFWQAFRAITLPSLRPALVPAVIISVVWTFNMFNIIYLVTAGEPGGATEILVTQAYKFAFERYRYGYAAAYSTIIFIILLGYGMVQNRVSKGTEA